MELTVLQINESGLVFEGADKLYLSNRARIPGTKGLIGYGMVSGIVWLNDAKNIRISWAHHEVPKIKVGDKVKFTRQ